MSANSEVDIGKLRHDAHVHIEKIFSEFEHQSKVLKRKLHQSEVQLNILNEKAALETNKANELVSWLAEERKKWEREKLGFQEKLKEKDEQLASSRALNQVLVVKLNEHNDDLLKARHSLIMGWKASASGESSESIGVKLMADFDTKPYVAANLRIPSINFSERVTDKAMEVGSLWEENLKDPSWYPFKIIMDEEGKTREVIDEEDEKLKNLKMAFGDEVFEVVTTALAEMSGYNHSGSYPMLELWNFKEGRKASLAEGVSYILGNWKPTKHKRIDECSQIQNKRLHCQET